LTRRAVGLGALLALLGGAAPATTAQACDAGRHVSASRGAGAHGRAPLVLGDSTMIFAAPVLGALGLEADARGCRGFADGVRIIAERRHAGTLPHVVVLALGANGGADAERIRQALAVTGRGRVLALVTPRKTPGATVAMRAAAARYPDRVLLIDWVNHSAGHGGWFAGDGLHVGQEGARAYARLIRRRVEPFAFPPAGRLALPSRAAGSRACGTVRRSGRALRVYVTRGEDRIACRRAQDLVRRPPLHPIAGWRVHDWRATGDGPWDWVLVRRDRRVVVGAVER
jgi:hypothetical protein